MQGFSLFSAKVMFSSWKLAFQVEIVSFRVNLALAGLGTKRCWRLSAVLDGVRSHLCVSDGGGTPCPWAAPLCDTLACLQHPTRAENHLRPVSNRLRQGFVVRWILYAPVPASHSPSWCLVLALIKPFGFGFCFLVFVIEVDKAALHPKSCNILEGYNESKAKQSANKTGT